jgi:AraC-like DNA-binding protein/mannose-6-phosphate isomerase-like protein (cupin superfamily)
VYESNAVMQPANCVTIPPRKLSLLTATSERAPKLTVFYSDGSANNKSSKPHSHSFFELFFVEEGEGWYSMGVSEALPSRHRRVWAKPGDLFLIAPGEIHDPSGLDGATKWVVCFEAEALNPAYSDADIFLMLPNKLLESFLSVNNLESKHFYIPETERSRWIELMKQLKHELCDRGFGFSEAARALLMLLLIETARLVESEPIELKKSTNQYRPIVNKVLRFIEDNFQNSIGLQEVAKAVNLSPAYLTDTIRRETGKTVLSWIVERRMTEARRLLVETDRSVNQIAEAVGYFDPSYFIRLFRRLNGTTPQAWRLVYRN